MKNKNRDKNLRDKDLKRNDEAKLRLEIADEFNLDVDKNNKNKCDRNKR